MIASKDLVSEIEEKKKKIIGNPDYYAKRAQRIADELRHLGDIHSYWLETPELRQEILRQAGVVTPNELKEKAARGIGRVKRAWKYLDGLEGKEELFYFRPETALKVAKFIEPYTNKRGFRKFFVEFGLEHTPPSPQIIDMFLERFFKDIKDPKYSAIERAALAHLNFAYIQAFEDGNKRTGRLFQDKVLKDAGLPPAVVPYGERAVYKDALRYALSGLRRKDPEYIRPFVDFIGGKVNIALDEILNDLNVVDRK